jgi:26S proteasome regulatory subunit N12
MISVTIQRFAASLLGLWRQLLKSSALMDATDDARPNKATAPSQHDAPPYELPSHNTDVHHIFLPTETPTMAEAELHTLIRQLHQALHNHNYQQCQQLLARAKVTLLHLNALIPSPQTPTNHLLAAREILELGAIASIRMNNEQSPDSFTRYFQQLQPFYALPASHLPTQHSQQSRVTGLYLLLLLSTSDYGGFHTMLETLEMARASAGRKGLEEDEFIQYPVRLEQALMEGSYDRVWQETKGSNVPGEEYGIFSGVSRFYPTEKAMETGAC